MTNPMRMTNGMLCMMYHLVPPQESINQSTNQIYAGTLFLSINARHQPLNTLSSSTLGHSACDFGCQCQRFLRMLDRSSLGLEADSTNGALRRHELLVEGGH